MHTLGYLSRRHRRHRSYQPRTGTCLSTFREGGRGTAAGPPVVSVGEATADMPVVAAVEAATVGGRVADQAASEVVD